MKSLKFKGKPVHVIGNLVDIHRIAPNFIFVDRDLNDMSLAQFKGKRKILATVPSLDTGVCSTMTKHLNEFAKKHPNILVLIVSADLPFAQKRFCEHENVHNVILGSMMRDKKFGESYGLLLADGPLAGLLSRSLHVLDEKDHVLYVELVEEITQEPNYHKAFEVVLGHHKK